MFERTLDRLNDAVVEQALAAVSKQDPSLWQAGHAAGVVQGLRLAQTLVQEVAREDHVRNATM